jgi:hypothetical protein
MGEATLSTLVPAPRRSAWRDGIFITRLLADGGRGGGALGTPAPPEFQEVIHSAQPTGYHLLE